MSVFRVLMMNQNKTIRNLKRNFLLVVLVILMIVLSSSVLGYGVTRSVQAGKKCSTQNIVVTLTVDWEETGSNFVQITDYVPTSWTVVSTNGNDPFVYGTVRILSFTVLRDSSTSYTVRMPTSGNIDWNNAIAGYTSTYGFDFDEFGNIANTNFYVRRNTCLSEEAGHYEDGDPLQEYDDYDGDGYGYGCTCSPGECNDNDADIHPGADEINCDGIDNDCNSNSCCRTTENFNYQGMYYDAWFSPYVCNSLADNEKTVFLNRWFAGNMDEEVIALYDILFYLPGTYANRLT